MQLSNFTVTGLSNEAHRALKKYTSTGDNTDEQFFIGTRYHMMSGFFACICLCLYSEFQVAVDKVARCHGAG